MTRILKSKCAKLWPITLLLLLNLGLSAQKSGTKDGVSYVNFPMDRQLFPRTVGSNQATIKFSGTIHDNVLVRLQIWVDSDRDGNYDEENSTFEPIGMGSSSGPVTFEKQLIIPAQLYNRRIRLLSGTNWVVTSFDIVAGDAYYIQGQSNAEARPMPGDENLANNDPIADLNWVRVYGGGKNMYTKAWGVANANNNADQDFNIGQFGMRLAKRIVQEKGVPVCILNGAERGFHIDQFQRNDANPTDLTTNYGRELTRATEAGLKNNIRAVIWFQGEQNTVTPNITSTTDYKIKFNQLFADWDQDYGLMDKYYIIQIRPGCDNGNSSPATALPIQEAQRELVLENNRFEIISTNSLQKYTADNCHYFYETGYKVIGDRVYTLINRDFYGGTVLADSITPKLRHPSLGDPVRYTAVDINGNPNQITIHFADPSVILGLKGSGDIKDRFELTGGNYTINTVQLTNISSTSTPEYVLRVNYSRASGTSTNPTGVSYKSLASPDAAPHIATANGEGVSLISFNASLGEFTSLPIDPLALRISTNANSNTLVWELDNNQDFDLFEIERGESSNKLKSINEVAANGIPGKGHYQYVDHKPNSVKNFYRIKATKTNGNILYSQVVAVNNNASTRPGISVYPNPAKDQANVSLTVQKAGNATIQIFDGAGALVSTRKLALLKGTNMFSVGEVLDHGPGIYLVRVVTEEEVFNTRLVRMK